MESGIYKKIAYSFVGVTILIIFTALWFSSVKATVTVTAKREPTNVSVDVDIAKVPKENELPGRVVQSVFEKTDSYKATSGEGKKVTGVSEGTVRISNRNSTAQPLVVKTRLLAADGRLYRIDDSVTVPAGGSVDVGAYADEEGGAYDFADAKSFTIPGLSESMQKLVTAKSMTPFEGGEQTIHVVAESDIAAAEESLKKVALDEAKTALAKEVSDPRFPDTVFITNTVERNTSAQVGDTAEDFLMSVKTNVAGVFYSRADLDALVRERVKDRVPTGREFASVGAEGMRVSYAVSMTDTANERARLTATADVQTKPTTADNLVSKEAIAGLSLDEAASKIRNMPGVEDVEITIRPSWVKRLPTLKDHIVVKVR
jgi:hypothetical protein